MNNNIPFIAVRTVSPARARFARIALWIAFFLAVTYFFTFTGAGAIDFEGYHNASKAVAAQINPYNLREQGLSYRPYFYPPLLAIGLLPIAPLPYNIAAVAWLAFNFALLVFTVALVSRYIADPRLRLLWWVAPVFFTPTLQALVHGQATVVMFALLAGAWVAMQEKRPALAGALLAVAVWIKIYPIVLIFYFIWKRERRVVLGAFIGGIVLWLIQLLWVGWPTFQYFITEVLLKLAVEGEYRLAHVNFSVLGFAQKLSLPSLYVQPIADSTTLYSIIRFGLGGLIAGVTALVCSLPVAYGRSSARKRDLEFGLVTVAQLLLASTLWESGMLPFLLAYLFLARDALETNQPRTLVLCVLSIALIDTHRVLWLIAENQTLPALLLSMPFFGAFLLWALTGARVYSLRASAAAEAPVPGSIAPQPRPEMVE